MFCFNPMYLNVGQQKKFAISSNEHSLFIIAVHYFYAVYAEQRINKGK